MLSSSVIYLPATPPNGVSPERPGSERATNTQATSQTIADRSNIADFSGEYLPAYPDEQTLDMASQRRQQTASNSSMQNAYLGVEAATENRGQYLDVYV